MFKLAIAALAVVAVVASAVANPDAEFVSHFTEKSLRDVGTNESICASNVNSYAGYYALTATKHYFYWFFESQQNPSTDPVILWLTGGPGCASELALFYENGPCTINDDLSTKANPYSWNTFANLLYVDNPVGAGFSYGLFPVDYDRNEDQIANDLYKFIQDFITAHPEFAKNEFFVFGESYAGHYVPALGYKIYTANQGSEGKYKINLKGIAIGNGLTDPEVQYRYYPEYAFNNPVKPLITQAQYNTALAEVPGCIALIAKCQNGTIACFEAETLCNSELLSPPLSTGVNQYDISKNCTYPPLCYDFDNLNRFLAQTTVRDTLGVGKHTWSQCNNLAHEFLTFDWMKNYQDKVPPLLASNITVLVYNGENDFVCNYKGSKAWTLALDWAGNSGFNAAGDHTWNGAGGVAAGLARSYGGLTFLQVFKAGHMVPLDQPANALAMVASVVSHTPF
ncbi:serine carboxypeptidase [Capsaspora owczarzaki ATCC 30864]|uniref:Carboxypeptidase n=1 Tax=Capsaspora owczarzaki (strain ATCC 30864) TaxID=595528 RepID=A0A0D2UCB9_CAPO3|nr:serine carboxypeptidase [Capsaspora owczarzaki ATCC 30864]KJE92641.1 serine carboxypeptidase [Capsaspora owczarzaki ATCC 30864]|eukprot:XP_004363289.2 serine carboxypeptidase [Capsaspora owczarzaki ATCC 30864]